MSLPFKPTVAWSKLYSHADAKGQYVDIYLANYSNTHLTTLCLGLFR